MMNPLVCSLIATFCFGVAAACSGSDSEGDGAAGGASGRAAAGAAAAGESTFGGAPAGAGGAFTGEGGAASGEGAATGEGGAASSAEGLCSAVDTAAVSALMAEELTVETDTNLLCKLQSAGSASFVVQRVLTNGAARYDQKADLLGVEEELEELGDRAFRSGYMYGIQLGEQYIEITFATSSRLDASGRLETVSSIISSLG